MVKVEQRSADDLWSGITAGLLAGVLLALAYLKNTLFGLTTKKVYAIAVGDHLIIFILLGILHALWK